MAYVEFAVSAVPAANRARFIEESGKAADALMANGALSVTENWGVDVPEGKVTDFPRSVQCKDDEVVVVSSIHWPSKDARDGGWAAVMDSPALSGHDGLLDMSRMIFGGFEQIVARP